MNVVDSSGWIEFFLDGPNADFFAEPLGQAPKLLVPSISIYEVFKRLATDVDEEAAKAAVAQMCRARVVPLDDSGAIAAALLASETGLPMADAIMLSCARMHGAALWTQDADFKGMEGVHYLEWRRS